MNSDVPAGFAERLKEAAARAGGTGALSRKSGIPRSTLGTYLSGQRLPDVAQLIAIAMAARVYVQWLAMGEGPMRIGEPEGSPRAPGLAEQPEVYGTPFNEREFFVVAADVLELIEEEELDYSAEEKARLIIDIYKEKMARARNGEPELRAAEIVRLIRRRA